MLYLYDHNDVEFINTHMVKDFIRFSKRLMGLMLSKQQSCLKADSLRAFWMVAIKNRLRVALKQPTKSGDLYLIWH